MMNIYQSIAAVMADCGAVGKDAYNPQGKFKYRGIDAVMNALNPALTKNRVFVVPEVLEQMRDERETKNGGTLLYSILKVKYTFYAEDGSSVSATVIGEGFDSGDKASNKAMAVAFKYALFQVFCIPTEEMVDPDAECHEVKSNRAATAEEGLTDLMVKTIRDELERTGISEKSLCKNYGINYLKDLHASKYKEVMDILKGKPTK